MLLKNKPLMIGVMAVIALLITGAVYFFVIRDNDSAVDTDTDTPTNGSEEPDTNTDTPTNGSEEPDTDTPTNGSEEPVTDTGTGTEDDGSAVLVAMGFDCQTTTIAAEAVARVAQAQAIAAEDPGAEVLAQLYADLIDESVLADNEVLKCSHAEKQLDVLVAPNAVANLYLTISVQVACAAVASDGIPPEGQELYLQSLKSDFEVNSPLVIGSQTYSADRQPQQQLKALFQAAEIEYTSAPAPEFTCAA